MRGKTHIKTFGLGVGRYDAINLCHLFISQLFLLSKSQLPTACTQGEAPGIAPKGKVPAVNFEAIFRA